MRKEVTIYTDGGCRGNGKDMALGGYGAILMYGDKVKEIKKGFENTTNYRYISLQEERWNWEAAKEGIKREIFSK